MLKHAYPERYGDQVSFISLRLIWNLDSNTYISMLVSKFYVVKVWWALWDPVELRIIGALMRISQRVNMSNTQDNITQTHSRIMKYHA